MSNVKKSTAMRSINVGDRITSQDGHLIIIKKVFILNVHLDPTAYIEYNYVTVKGKTGTEVKGVRSLIRMLKDE